MAIKNMDNSISSNYLQAAIDYWNYSFGSLSGANISITNTNINAVNRIEMINQMPLNYGGTDTLGYYLPNSFNAAGYTTNFDIKICYNSIVASRPGYSTGEKWLTYHLTVAHELGHALNLKDNPPNKYSIMNYDYPDEGRNTAPEYFDVYGVFKSNPIY